MQLLEELKTYISARPWIEESYEDEELSKALNFSSDLLNIFYGNTFIDKDPTILFEEAIYVLQNNPSEQWITKYEGLESFSIAGAITASVSKDMLSYLSPLVKLKLQALGIEQNLNDSTSISYGYSIF